MFARVMPFDRVGCGVVFGVTLIGQVACFGGQSTGDLDACPWQVLDTLETDNQRSDHLGFSVDDLRWAFRAEEEIPAEWRSVDAVPSNVSPGPTSLSYSVNRDAGSVLVVGDCETRYVEVPVTLQLTTADGLLSEELPGKLRAYQPAFASVSSALDMDSVGGLFQASLTRMQQLQSSLEINMTSTASSGGLRGALQTGYDDEVSSGGIEFMAWPVGSLCSTGEVPVSLDENQSDPMWGLLSGMNGTWQGSGAANISFALEPSSIICASAGARPSLPASVSVVASPSTIFQGRVEVSPGPSPALEFNSNRVEVPPETFVRQFGSLGLDLEGYDQVALTLTITVTSTARSGRLRVSGYAYQCPEQGQYATCGSGGEVTLFEGALMWAMGQGGAESR